MLLEGKADAVVFWSINEFIAGRNAPYGFAWIVGYHIGFCKVFMLGFIGSNGFVKVNGLSLIDTNRHHDINVTVNHLDNSCTSSQLFKFILSDSSTGVFNGKVVVGKDTFQTNANQTNRNLLLSPSSNMNSNPQLEIHAEDVKCSHGSTTGQIDPEALFYLRSRGISKQRAIELVVEGFAKEIFTNIKDDIFQSKINQKIGQWLESVSNHDKS